MMPKKEANGSYYGMSKPTLMNDPPGPCNVTPASAAYIGAARSEESSCLYAVQKVWRSAQLSQSQGSGKEWIPLVDNEDQESFPTGMTAKK